MPLPLLPALAAAAFARAPDPYHGCRPEALDADLVLHRCPGLMLTEAPGPLVAPEAALAALREQHRGKGEITDLKVRVGDEPLPVFAVKGASGRLVVAAVVVPGGELRVLQCAPSEETQVGLVRCSGLFARAAQLGLPAPGSLAVAAAPPPPPGPRGEAPARPDTAPTAEGPRFRGRPVPLPPDCAWALTGQDVGSITCPAAVLTLGRVPVTDPQLTLDRLTDPHVSAAKAAGFKNRVKRITASCALDGRPALCEDLRLSPPDGAPYRLLVGAVEEQGSTWFASCLQQTPTAGVPAPCDRLIADWPPPGVADSP